MLIILSDFSNRLRAEIDRIGVSALARNMGTARNTLYNWCEKGNIPFDKLLLMGDFGVDVSYVINGAKEVNLLTAEESILVSKYRQANDKSKHKALMLLLGSEVESTEKVVVSSPANSGFGNQNNGGNQTINNAPVNSGNGNQYNAESQTFHRKESGFTDLPYSIAAALCAFTAWGLGWLANHIGLTDKALSFDVGIPAILLWVMAIILAVFATEKRKMMKNDRLSNAE